MTGRWLFAGVAVLAFTSGTVMWLLNRTPPGGPPRPEAPSISAAALYAATGFRDLQGQAQTLGRFHGQTVVLNFWATWCAPCVEEMPAFERLQARWRDRQVRFVGISGEQPEPVAAFAQRLGITYTLWTGGEAALDLSRRLGNRLGVLPHTVVLGPDGQVLANKVGTYSEIELEALLQKVAVK